MAAFTKHAFALVLVLAMAMLLAGCPGNVRPPLGTADIATPEHTITEKRVFVPIDGALTAHGGIEPAGPPSDAERVAKARGTALLACYAQLDAIRAIQGTAVSGNPGSNP